jgi:protein-S-isoprenylcysteine O-methyltransferase Ste14|tara:strand:- start:1546 stop:2121 length:576 start_codon:yes stop_codon:yes gene_type:complete
MILIIADTIIGICLFALFTSILINFAESSNKNIKKEKKSIVETGTMTLFFIAFYILIRFKIGEIIVNTQFRNYLILVGLIMIVAGCIINIAGRFNLGKNWANQVKIYNNQTFIKRGMFKVVRHPLYASLMLMFYGACLVYPNYLAFLANTFIFIPFMYYRAKQEESLLLKTFKEYKQYKKEVGMFFPKIIK